MKKIIIIGIAILSVVLIGWWWLSDDIERTPETALREVTKGYFGVNIEVIEPIVTHFEEHWCPNGDGDCRIEFKYEGDHPAFFKQFNRLPFKADPTYGTPVGFPDIKQGYYMLVQDNESFMVLIINSQNRTGTLLYVFS